MKVSIIGAGSIVFAKNLIGDILRVPEFDGSTIALMDIDAARLAKTDALARVMVEQTQSHIKIESSTDRREAVRGADYVITTFQIGGLEYYEKDIRIPEKYGLDQSVGDTLGPGGILRGLRTIPVMLDLCRDMEELCSAAWLLNYVNPMAIVTWGINRGSRVKCVGLCHSVQNTAADIASYINIPADELVYETAGINHMAWFLTLKHNGKDCYPQLKKAAENPAVVNKDLTKFEVLKNFGYFITESSYHVSEYMPYFRKPMDREFVKRLADIDSWLKNWGGYCFPMVSDRQDDFYEKLEKQLKGLEPVDVDQSREFGAGIMYALETDKPFKIYGNVMNRKGLIENLPDDCCVEVPCLVDKTGIHPCSAGKLPPQLAALNMTNINVQRMAIEAHFSGDPDAVVQAVMLDPLTAASVPYDKIRDMVYEMLQAEKELLPQFRCSI